MQGENESSQRYSQASGAVVDDDPDTAEVLMILLTLIGREPTYALRGREAIRLVRQLDPDIVILTSGSPTSAVTKWYMRAVDRAGGALHRSCHRLDPHTRVYAPARRVRPTPRKPFDLAQPAELVRRADAPRANNVR